MNDKTFEGIKPFEKKIYLSSPTMHGEEQKWVDYAFDTNWVTTIGENINEIEKDIANKIGVKYSVALASGTAALHLAIKICAEVLYGKPKTGHGYLEGKKVFASDLTFAATVNPIAYENGEAIFIDSEYETWNMDPKALEKAFELYPDVKLIVVAHLYGTPAKIDEIRKIADKHSALIVEDAAESFCSTYKGKQTGSFGDISIISFNGNKLITGSSGGMLLTNKEEWASKARKWSTQSRENVPWYEHQELGYNYRMSNIVAGVVRGQLPYAEEHKEQKNNIYLRYKNGLKDLPVEINPSGKDCDSNTWLTCLTINQDCIIKPLDILEKLSKYNVEGRPIWKPMHLQPIYKDNIFVSIDNEDVGKDIFERGLCLPSDNKMTKEQQDIIIDIIHRCFNV